MSYVKTKRIVHSPKYAEKRRRHKSTLLFLGVLCVLTISATIILLLRAPFFQIQHVTVEGSTLAPKEIIEAAALAALQGNYIKIIPHTSTFFYPKGKLMKDLEEKFKGAKSFAIHRSGLSGLKITVTERAPAAVVCAGFRDENEETDCYWTDERGYIFSLIPSPVPTDAYNHYYVPTDEGSTTPGYNFVPQKRFSELQAFLGGAAKGGLLPLGVLVSHNGEYEMYIQNQKGDSEATVYFDDRSPLDSTLENLLTFWENASKSKKATSTPEFDYINLRFGNTVYYSSQ